MRCIFLVYISVWLSVSAIAQHERDSKVKPAFEFVPNKGQWHPLALYKATIPHGNLYLERAALVYDLVHPEDYKRIQDWQHAHPAQLNDETPRRHAVRIRFANVDYAPRTETEYVQSHYYNYFIGNEESKWASEVHPVGKVAYKEVYPDINFEISGISDIKYQWVIKNPTKAKVARIQCVIEGGESIELVNGELKIGTSAGLITDGQPFVYQVINGQVIELNSKYVLKDSFLSYEIQGDINTAYPLIIDPKLIFSTYSGTVGDNFGFTATYDSRGNLYAGGIVNGAQGPYPVTSGAFDTTYNGGVSQFPAGLPCDISISKYDSAGTSLIWATYLGGKASEYPHSLVCDRNNDLVILGTSYSTNFPFSNGCFDSTHGGSTDIVVSKLSENGTALLGSTYMGGTARDGLTLNDPDQYLPGDLKYNYSDDFRGDVITDDDGNIYVSTTTNSDFLPVKDAIQTRHNGTYDGYIFELSSDFKQLNWATYLGGSGQDALYSIKLDGFNNIVVGGGTSSSDLPTTDSSLQKTNKGDIDGVIAIFDKSTKGLKQITYWGTPKYDQIYFIETDAQGRIYATGQTEGNIVKSAGVYGESGKGQFIIRLDSTLQKIDLQTTFGNTTGKPNLVPSAFLVDVCDHIYFSGWGSAVDARFHPGSTTGMAVSNDAVQKKTDNEDFYVIVFGRDAKELLYATYFGGDSTGDHVDGGTSRFDKKGVVYQSVCSSCPEQAHPGGYQDFPTTAGAAYEKNPSVRCSNASFKIDLQIKSAVIADFVVNPLGCVPHQAVFTNKSVLGNNFVWDFGDGTTSTDLNPMHIYSAVGTYTATLKVIDSNTCNISSVYSREIKVLAQSNADFNASFDGCDNKLVLENKSTNGITYHWNFGDSTYSDTKNPNHQFEIIGTYVIKLIVNKGLPCESFHAQTVVIDAKKTPQIKLFNVFTPNGDGVNDCFRMEGEFLECNDYSLKIYNRWGERVFETDNPETCWYGGVFGQEELLPPGTYYYVLQLGKDKTSAISGIVEMLY